MSILGPNYPFDQADALPILLFDDFQTSLPPAYPTVDTLRLRNSIAHTKIRVVVDDISLVAQIENGFGFWVKRIGDPVGFISVEYGVTATANTPPSSMTLGTTHLDVSTLSDVDWTYVVFPEVVTPIGNFFGNRYMWVVVTGDFAISSVDTLAIAATSLPPPVGIPDSGYYQFDGSSWSNSATNLYASGTGGRTWNFQHSLAQVISITSTLKLNKLVLSLLKAGSPVGNLWVEIRPVKDYGSPVCFWPPEYQDSHYDPGTGFYSVIPNADVIAVSRMVDCSTLGTLAGQISFLFDTSPSLLFGERYAFVLKCSATLSLVNNIGVGIDLTSSYDGGSLASQNVALAQPSHVGGGFELVFGSLVFESYFTEANLLNTQIGRLGAPPADVCDMQGWLLSLVTVLENYFPSVIPETYGGTGESDYAKGDILYAIDDDNLTRLSAGPLGTVLTMNGAGLPEWAKGGGQILEQFWNKDSVQIDPGELVVFKDVAVTPPGAFQRSTTPALDTMNFCGVAVQPVLPNTQGFICTYGPVQVRLSGTCQIGDSLFLAATLGRAIVNPTSRGVLRAMQVGADGQLIWAFLSGPVSATPPGGMIVWPSTTLPYGWLAANGQLVSRTTYAKLFAVIGASFGAGDGTTTFALPDLRGRVPIGMDNMGNGAGAANRVLNGNADVLGGSGGEENHVMTTPEMPAHAHDLGYPRIATNTGQRWSGAAINRASDSGPNGGDNGQPIYATDSTGGGGAHNNMQPWIAMQWIIRYA